MKIILAASVAFAIASALTQDSRASNVPQQISNTGEDQEFELDLEAMLFDNLTEEENARLGFTTEEKITYANEFERWLNERGDDIYPVDFAQIINSGQLTEEHKQALNLTGERKVYLDGMLDRMADVNDDNDLFIASKGMPDAFSPIYLGNSTSGEMSNITPQTSGSAIRQNASTSTIYPVGNSSLTMSLNAGNTSFRNSGSGPIVIGDFVTSTAGGSNGTIGLRNASTSTLTRLSGGVSVKPAHQTSAIFGGALVATLLLLL